MFALFGRKPAPPFRGVVPMDTLLGPRRDVALEDTAEAVALEQAARTREMFRHIHHTLLAESRKDHGHRNAALLDFCLDARALLQPSVPGSEVLREMPAALPQRRAVPVIPGGAM